MMKHIPIVTFVGRQPRSLSPNPTLRGCDGGTDCTGVRAGWSPQQRPTGPPSTLAASGVGVVMVLLRHQRRSDLRVRLSVRASCPVEPADGKNVWSKALGPAGDHSWLGATRGPTLDGDYDVLNRRTAIACRRTQDGLRRCSEICATSTDEYRLADQRKSRCLSKVAMSSCSPGGQALASSCSTSRPVRPSGRARTEWTRLRTLPDCRGCGKGVRPS